MLKTYRYFTSAGGGWTSDARRTFFSSSTSVRCPVIPPTLTRSLCRRRPSGTMVDGARRRSDCRRTLESRRSDDLRVVMCSQLPSGRTSSVARPSDVAFPPGHEFQRLSTIWHLSDAKDVETRKLLHAGVLPSQILSTTHGGRRLSSATSQISVTVGVGHPLA